MGIYDRGYYRADSTQWQQSYRSPRSVVVTLIIVNVVIWGLDAFTPRLPDSASHVLSRFMALKMGFAAGELPFYQQFPWNIWQLLTYGFAHTSISAGMRGVMHIAFNMLTLFFLGRPVEEKYGKQEFLRFYLLAVIFAGAVWMAFYLIFPPGVPVIGVGASGGVMAVAILFIFNFPHSTLLVFGVVPVRAWVVGVILIGVDLLNSLNPETRIGWQAHLAGAAFGAAYFYFKWNFTFIPLNKIGNLFKAQPKLKVHQPDHKDERLREQADQILDKLHRQGEASLTSRERKILERYSRSVRQNRGDQS